MDKQIVSAISPAMTAPAERHYFSPKLNEKKSDGIGGDKGNKSSEGVGQGVILCTFKKDCYLLQTQTHSLSHIDTHKHTHTHIHAHIHSR